MVLKVVRAILAVVFVALFVSAVAHFASGEVLSGALSLAFALMGLSAIFKSRVMHEGWPPRKYVYTARDVRIYTAIDLVWLIFLAAAIDAAMRAQQGTRVMLLLAAAFFGFGLIWFVKDTLRIAKTLRDQKPRP